MVRLLVTRNGQITLTKNIREKLDIKEGDVVMANVYGKTITLGKCDTKAFHNHNFLPDNFSKALKDMRSMNYSKRLRRLGVL